MRGLTHLMFTSSFSHVTAKLLNGSQIYEQQKCQIQIWKLFLFFFFFFYGFLVIELIPFMVA